MKTLNIRLLQTSEELLVFYPLTHNVSRVTSSVEYLSGILALHLLKTKSDKQFL